MDKDIISTRWKPLIMATNYKTKDLRAQLEDNLEREIERSAHVRFKNVITEELQHLYQKEMSIPIGIAGTNALLENIFCKGVCIQAGKQLIITGGVYQDLIFSLQTI
eukprot:TRINITY_DN12288_c0_g1_i1.p1 TRINITY_DN12288_c0_g1~~TRINITY_DN12288_c0_g1_i1.p1  ORF type:complete len:107 (+),score=15.88 TRINITY_DN12288_c0_g1_i1:83-403(+)